MLTPKCYQRKCIHYLGVSQPDGTELTERVICNAFPDGIPDSIAYGSDQHLNIRIDQVYAIVFEKKRRNRI